MVGTVTTKGRSEPTSAEPRVSVAAGSVRIIAVKKLDTTPPPVNPRAIILKRVDSFACENL
jgi:hypothetical protein